MDLRELRGSWALVTGASSGIGREFATRLAAAGLNVVLVARREALLEALGSELSAQGIATKPVVLDLTDTDGPKRLCVTLEEAGIRPRLVVNNAGAGRWGRFEAWSAEDYLSMLQLNVEVVVALCHTLLPKLALQTPSAIVNVSSPAALQPVPYMAAYAASKAFVHNFSLALYEEWRGRGVYVQTLLPGPTATEFDAKAGAYASALGKKRAPTSEVVSISLRAFATEAPVAVAAHGIFGQRVFAALAPPRKVVAVVGKMFRPPDDAS